MKKTLLALIAVTILGSIATGVCSAYLIAHSWADTTTDKYYSMNEDFAEQSKLAFHNANMAWNNVSGRPFNIYRLTTDNTATDFNRNGINEVFRNSAGPAYLMACLSYYSDEKAVEFDIAVNLYYAWGNSGASTVYDVQNVATHETGHALWSDDLTAASDSEKTMYQWAAIGETKKRTLEQDDIDGWLASNK